MYGARSRWCQAMTQEEASRNKVKYGKFHVNTRKTVKVTVRRHGLPREAVSLHRGRHSGTVGTRSCAMPAMTLGPTAVPSPAPALTSPPVFLREPLPGLQPGAVRAVGRQVRGADEAGAALGLQHHLQLGEALLVALPPLVVQGAAAHHVAGGGLADLPLGVALRARRVRLPLVRQVPQDGQVALLAGHCAAGAREPPRTRAAEEPPGIREGGSGSAPARREPRPGGNWSVAARGGGREGEARAAVAAERQNGCCTSGSEVGPRTRRRAREGAGARGSARGSGAAILEPGRESPGARVGPPCWSRAKPAAGARPWRREPGTLPRESLRSPGSETEAASAPEPPRGRAARAVAGPFMPIRSRSSTSAGGAAPPQGSVRAGL